MDESRKAVRYFLDRTFRAGVMWVMNRIMVGAREREPDLRGEDIKKILLVRSLFRMGDSILATPAISLLRQNFPEATIDFVGPEDRETLSYLSAVLAHRVPIIFDLDARSFASMVANCELFVACDSGPLHVACALGVRTVAIFLKNNFDRWGPPPELSRIVFCESGVGVTDVLKACQIELSALCSESVAGRIVNG